MSMNDDIKKEIADLREGGFSDSEIAEYYTQEMTEGGIPHNEIRSFLNDFGIKPGKAVATPSPEQAAASKKPTLSLGVGEDALYGETGSPELYRQAADKAMKQLPTVGATAGGIALSEYGPLGTSTGAGFGGAGGSLLESALRKITGINPISPRKASDEALGVGGEMSAWELGGAGVGKIISKVLAPVADAFKASPEAQKVMDFATKNDVAMSPSTVMPSKTAKVVEGAVNLVPTGKMITSKYQTKTYQKLLDMRDQLFASLSGTALPGGKPMKGSILNKGYEVKKGVSGAYENVVDAAGHPETLIPMNQTKAYLDSIYEKAPKKVRSLINEFNRKLMSGSNIPSMEAQNFNSWQAKIYRQTNKNDVYDVGNKIWEFVEQDLAAFDKDRGKMVLDALKNAKMDAKMAARYWKVARLFKDTSRATPDGDLFDVNAFYNKVNDPANQRMLATEFGEDVLQNVKDLSEQFMVMAKESGKKKMSDAEKVWHSSLGLGGIAAPFYNAWLTLPYGFSAAASYSMMQPRGVVKKWLTTGFKVPEAAKQSLMVGGRAAISGRNTRGTGGSW